MATSTLEVLINAKDNATKTMKSIGAAGVAMGNVMASAFIATGKAAVDFFGDSVKASMEAESAMAVVSQQVKNSGLAYEDTMDKIDEYAQKQLMALGVDDERTSQIVSTMLPTLKNVEEATRLTTIALNMEAAGKMDAMSATRALMLANEGNIDALKKVIPELKLMDQEQLKSMSSAEKSKMALELLEKTYGNIGETVGNTSSGQMKIMEQMWGNFQEEIGSQLLPLLTELGKTLLPIISEYLPKLIDAVKNMATAVIDTITGLNINWKGIWEGIQVIAMAAWVFFEKEIIPVAMQVFEVIKAAVLLFKSAWDSNFGGIRDIFSSVFNALVGIFQAAWATFKGILDFLLGVFTGDWKKAWDGIKQVFSALWEAMKAIVTGAVDVMANSLKGFIKMLQSAIDKILEFIGAKADISGDFSTTSDYAQSFLGTRMRELLGKANGGPVSGGTTYLVGERGPELFTPNASGNITPNNKLGGYYFDFSGATLLSENAAVEIVDMVIGKLGNITKLPS